MGRTSCVSYPREHPYIKIYGLLVEICDNNLQAAMLLAYYIYWHDIKLEIVAKNKKTNDIAEFHGDYRTQDESTYQYHSLDELMRRAVFNSCSRPTIIKANGLLEKKGFISKHRNPNPKYGFDKTTYYQVHVEKIQLQMDQAISKQNKGLMSSNGQTDYRSQNLDYDSQDINHRESNSLPGESTSYLSQSKDLLPIADNNNTISTYDNNNKEINKQSDGCFVEKASLPQPSEQTQSVIALCVRNGFPIEKLTRPADLLAIQKLNERKATLEDWQLAFNKAFMIKGEEVFSLHYVVAILTRYLDNSKRQSLAYLKREEQIDLVKNQEAIHQSIQKESEEQLEKMAEISRSQHDISKEFREQFKNLDTKEQAKKAREMLFEKAIINKEKSTACLNIDENVITREGSL